MNRIKKIGFIGLGTMGYPMAFRLIQAGYEVTVYDIRSEPAAQLEKEGAKHASSIADLAGEQSVIITMLQTGEQVKKVCLGETGIYLNAPHQSIHIDTSSIDVATTRELHERAETVGLQALDAPVSGGVSGAVNGTLSFAVGGNIETLAQVEPILNVLGKRIVHTGGAGNGQAAKICNNMLLAISMIGVSEAFSLAKKLGLSSEKFFEFSSHASGQCWSMTSYSPVPGLVENVPSNQNYKPGFTAALMLKDLHLSQEAAKSVNLDTTLGKAAEAIYQKFIEQQKEPIDFSAVIKMIENYQGTS